MATLALLVLPPNPRFFPWIGALIAFEAAQFLLLYPLTGLLAVTALMTAIALRLQRPLLHAVGDEPSTLRPAPKGGGYGWKSRATRGRDGSGPFIRSPINDDQCWAIQPPCSPFRSVLEKGPAAVDPLQ
jgi:hypothetical protein